MSTVVKTECAECGNKTEAWDDEVNPLCEICGCSTVAPDSISFYIAWMSGEGRATCEDCGKVWAGWDCACDLLHDCEKGN